jgi:mannose-6-phosphate isomerase-like protein (cupin superfamily)
MAPRRMPWIVLAAVLGIGLMAGSACAEDHAFNFNDEIKKGEGARRLHPAGVGQGTHLHRGAVAVTDEIKAQRHKDGDHVLYIVSGQGAMAHGNETIALKRGMVVHVPKAEVHAIKAQGGSHLTGLRPAALQARPDGVGPIA